MKKLSRIICAMPGSGKTWITENEKCYLRTSSKISVINADDKYFFEMFYKPEYHEEVIKRFGKKIVDYRLTEFINPNFVEDYSNKLKELYDSKEYDFILTGIHWDIRLKLYQMKLLYYVVLPLYDDEDTYIDRLAVERGQDIADFMHNNWESMQALYSFEYNKLETFKGDEYLYDVLNRIYWGERI